jgi:hypothetical protein
MKKSLIIFLACILTSVLCLGTVSAVNSTDSGTSLTSHKKTSDITTNSAKGTIRDTEKVYFKRLKDGKTYWYRFTTHYINWNNVYTNYVTSWGTSGYLQYKRGSTPSWYQITYGNFWINSAYKARKLGTNYNTYSASTWLTWLNKYNKYTLKSHFINS